MSCSQTDHLLQKNPPLIKSTECLGTQVSIVVYELRKTADGVRVKMPTRTNERGSKRNDDDNGDDTDANQICHLYLMSAVMKSLFACEQNAENAN